MKLPFLNRNRYVVVKAYTLNKRFLDDVPIVLTKDISQEHLNSKKLTAEDRRISVTFNSCYGKVAALRRSLTLRTWCEFEIKADEKSFHAIYPAGFEYFRIDHHKDHIFNPSGMFVAKLIPPWMVEYNKKDLNIVHCNHILNTTALQIASGIVPGTLPGTNFFSYIPSQRLHYIVPYKMPIVQWYPLTDLPIHVENYYDLEKYQELASMSASNPYKVGSAIKCMKNEDTSV